MQTITIQADFESWRCRARELLEDGVRPEEILWTDSSAEQSELFATDSPRSMRVREAPPVPVPKSFFSLAAAVACHSDPRRWAILYQLLWRLTRGGEKQLLIVSTDSDVRRADELAKEVQRDIHKMRAFVRFRKVGESDNGREQFVSWFEPTHHIVRRNASFFQKRFTGMDWSILTPEECAHWDGKEVHFTPGVTRDQAPDGDELEELWRSYYKSIFNPARLKLKAMQAEMPVKYWKNLPEASLIQLLATGASQRRDAMLETEGIEPRRKRKNLYLESSGDDTKQG
ncbi:MAG: TIGR03915 family putative DNA repair protein [Verrucomicrobiales bacterium]|nr:TIGR03915 family putative DNA repair protein [Verrucomicrobiales bacterium]